MIKRSLIAPILILIALIGCYNSPNRDVSTLSVVKIAEDDTEMAAAIETAKRTLGFFEKNWKTMENDGYSIKFALPTNDGELEHIWFSPTNIQDDKITGECANDPEKIPGLKLGDVMTVSRDDVSDWMIMVGNTCYGGYTIRVLAKRDPDIAPPFDFNDPPTKSD